MPTWRGYQKRELKKVVYALNLAALKKLLKDHLDRGWEVASPIKPHGNGVGVLVRFPKK